MKPFGMKARIFANRKPEDDRRINILHGSVRSAKTWAMIPKFLALSRYKVVGKKVIFGVSKQTIYNNVLDDLFSLLGSRNYNFNRQTGELVMMGSRWLVIGAKDEGSEKYVRGLTVGVAVGDELVLIPASFMRMMLNRMSQAGARFYGTTNPDLPNCYVYEELITNQDLIRNGSIWSEHFTLDDNPNLDPGYRKHLDAMYKGIYHQRFVQGLWVAAEGAIYRDAWSDELLYDDEDRPAHFRLPGNYAERYVPVDCGVDHPQVYQDHIDDGKVVWIDREYHWDSNLHELDPVTGKPLGGYQKTDGQYVDDLQEFMKGCPDAQVIVPPECASFEAEINLRGIWKTDADNEVLDGIKHVASMMALGLVRVRVNKSCRGKSFCECGRQCCTQLVKHLKTYIWDKKAKARGVEQPLKFEDDDQDCMRYGLKTKVATWRLLQYQS